jgi:hypothetical protein
MYLSSITTLRNLLPLSHARVLRAFNLQESAVQIFFINPIDI